MRQCLSFMSFADREARSVSYTHLIVSALSEERSYKAAFPLNEVLRILDDLFCQGKLCPFVVGILKRERWLVYDAIRRASAEASARYEQIYAEYFAL